MNRINIITLGVKDMAESIRFYRDGLGFQTHEKENTPEIVFFNTSGTKFALYPLSLLAVDIDEQNPPKIAEGFAGITLAYNDFLGWLKYMEKKNIYQLFMEEAPEAAAAFNGHIGSLQYSGLDTKTQQLIYISIKASQCGADAVAAHVPMAKQTGATWEEIKGAIVLTLTVSSVSGVLSCLAPAKAAYDAASNG
jgi:alkylhydroperoxidase/carboxymuconolactone decarboxylase family protein YurZ